MLILKSPNLRFLCIEGDWDEPIYEPRLLEGRWPRLRELRLGPMKFDFSWHIQDSTLPLLEFLEQHPSIEELSLAHVRVNLSRLSPYALPKLKILNGYMNDIRGLNSRRIDGQNAWVSGVMSSEAFSVREADGIRYRHIVSDVSIVDV